MAFTLNQARVLLNAGELALFQDSRRDAIAALTTKQLDARITRARALRDKYRDLYQRQTVSTRQGAAGQRRQFGGENDRTQRKAEMLADVLQRFELRLGKLQDAQPAKPVRPRPPAPGAAATKSGAPAPAQRIRKPATSVVPAGQADQPMRGATRTKKRDTARKDMAATDAAREVVQQRATGARADAAAPQRGTAKPASAAAPAVNLKKAVKRALNKPAKQADANAGSPRAARAGRADPALAARPTDVPAVAEQRLNPLKAKPVNKKIHASARSRTQKFQATKDGR